MMSRASELLNVDELDLSKYSKTDLEKARILNDMDDGKLKFLFNQISDSARNLDKKMPIKYDDFRRQFLAWSHGLMK